MITSPFFKNFVILCLFTLIVSCKLDQNYFPHNEGKQVFYNVFFQDKENKKKSYRQSFYFLPKTKNAIPVLKNDGEIIFYVFEERGISKKTREEFLLPNKTEDDSQLLIAYPITKDDGDKTETFRFNLGTTF